VIVATIGVAFVPPVIRMPRAADEQVPRLLCLMDMFLFLVPRNPRLWRRSVTVLLRRQLKAGPPARNQCDGKYLLSS
jgi:hypothetical protein